MGEGFLKIYFWGLPLSTPEPGARQEFQTAVCRVEASVRVHLCSSLSVLCTFASGFLSDCQSRRRGGVSERETATVIIVEAKFRFAGDEPSKQAEKSDVCYFLLDSYLV